MVLILDLLLAACFVLTMLDGVRNGFFREIFTLAGVGIGVWAAIEFSQPLHRLLPSPMNGVPAVGAALFLLICLSVIVAFRLTGSVFAVMWEGKKPSALSRIVGLGLGAVRGLVLVLVLAAGLTLLFPSGSRFLGGSRVLPYLSPGIVWGAELLPRDLGDRILWKWGQLPFDDRVRIPSV